MSKKNKSGANATYVRGILTIDLPHAISPVLWRQEIKDVTHISFALQVLPGGERALVLRANDGAEQIIASFGNQAAADEALAALREILLNPQSSGQAWRRGLWRILKWLVIVVLLWWAARFAMSLYVTLEAQKIVQEAESETAKANAPPEGVPIIADDYLQAPTE
ncbi:MAG TPA: hypothetical protein PKW15_04075 [Alphaproteobacteria bacterium]|nr:hypothetical protein [Rhodospirillaceae bacterium]HRJ12405.1 hypothetical protein [Alphaproteobacteria bacterium]